MRAELASLTASVLINVGILFSFDQTVVLNDQALRVQPKRLVKQVVDPVSFEFVEAPLEVSAQHPSNTRKISNRDSVNRDLTRDKTLAEKAPRVKTGRSLDQLAQKQAALLKQPARVPSAEKSTESLQTLKQSIQVPTGQDRITTSEVSITTSHGAKLYGTTSFEAAGSDLGKYMKNLKEKIWVAWFPYLMVHYPKDFKTADAIVSFKLNAKGEVKTVQLVESRGSPLFAAFCMESIQRAGSFGVISPEIFDLAGKDEFEIRFAFHYR